MLRKHGLIVIALTLLCMPHTAFAWDANGHEQIADIAWTRLNARAKREIYAILAAGDPNFRPKTDSDADVRRAFRLASTYADVIKGDRTTQYESLIEPMNRRFQPNFDPKTRDREAFLCKTWHYYDLPIRVTGAMPEIRESNALNALNEAIGQIYVLELGAQDRKMQCWWLYWIEHVTGDLHQPLHCTSSYEFNPAGDAGGNLYTLVDPTNPDRTMRLHGYWDGGITRAVEAESLGHLPDDVEKVTQQWTHNAALTPSTTDARNLDVMSWITAGAHLADQYVYTGIRPNTAPSADYIKAAVALSERQAVLAGYRLANILNATLGK